MTNEMPSTVPPPPVIEPPDPGVIEPPDPGVVTPPDPGVKKDSNKPNTPSQSIAATAEINAGQSVSGRKSTALTIDPYLY